ncbi:sterol desaturase family protein [Mangrovimonas sp. ST2L15]|uniref:sterol desaturase family protein n=1 Tax=Mangrovimonas sp. ST2L15 TaxID=1645916 RepID=UPI0006B59480|nr:sterol desaturase family protein [Mangrovimonas sp. ST2L15]
MMEERSYPFFLFLMALRYFVFAGIAFSLFYILFKRNFIKIKIQKLFPKRKDYRREIGFSFLTMVIFSLYAALIFKSPLSEFTKIYRDFSEHSIWYVIFSVILAILIHDTYFYWTHRMMHHPKLFKYFHLVHHKSTNPSPWASYSFHPLEALVEGGVILVVVMLIPIHPVAIALFMIFMLSYNVYGHLGFEIFPRWLLKTKLGSWFNTSTNHNMHHHYFKGNYGLYFRFWDQLMGTTHPKYQETLNQLKNL